MKIWSSSKHAEYYFVKEIEVGISTLGKDFPLQVVFVDTPGLSDPVAYRSDLTKEYIRRANAVFVCIDAQKIQREEIETISSVFAFSSDDKSKVHIIATHWDILNDPETDWAEQKNYLVKRLTGKAFFDKEAHATENIMYSAAFIYNLCRDYDSLSKKGRIALKRFALNFEYELPADLRKMKDKTNVAVIMKVIREKLAANYKKLLSREIQGKFINIIHNFNRVAKEKKDLMNELMATSRSSKQELEQKICEQQTKRDVVRHSAEQLREIIKQVKFKTKTRTDLICGKLRLKLSEGKR